MTRTAINQKALFTVAVVAMGAMALANRAQAQGTSQPDLNGAYQCQPDPTPCLWSGQSPSVSQSGTKLEIKNDKGEVATATLTSAITISAGGPMNSYGVVGADHSIEWSNGNKWRKP